MESADTEKGENASCFCDEFGSDYECDFFLPLGYNYIYLE